MGNSQGKPVEFDGEGKTATPLPSRLARMSWPQSGVAG